VIRSDARSSPPAVKCAGSNHRESASQGIKPASNKDFWHSLNLRKEVVQLSDSMPEIAPPVINHRA
jgi:hypothetical protein